MEKSDEHVADSVLKRSKAFLASRKNSNELISILDYYKDINNVEPPHILALELIFTDVLKKGQLSLDWLKKGEAEHKYRTWLIECYRESLSKLCTTLTNSSNEETQVQALDTLFKLLFAEGKLDTEKQKNEKKSENVEFPLKLMNDIIKHMVTSPKSISCLTTKLGEYTSYNNIIIVNILLALAAFVKTANKPSLQTVQNVLTVIESLPKDKSSIQQLLPPKKERQSFEDKDLISAIDNVWLWCVKHHGQSMLRRLLVTLLEHFLPLFRNPIFVADFLVNSLNMGGATSLLALQGIFVLIQKHNIDYPNIYGKLYSMTTAEIFTTKYKARFFYLLDLFLTSTHLPQKTVAAFVKRLSRLTLVAAPQDILILLPFIGNLLIRHPGLKKLIDHPTGGDVASDPYKMEETDPNLSMAWESSLWEVKILQQHILPGVSTAACFINNPLPSVEWDLATRLEVDANQIFEREKRKKAKTLTTTFERPKSLNVPRGINFDNLWCL